MTHAEKREQQIQRVDAFKAWLRAGAPAGKMPRPLPRDADFKVWREAHQAVTA